MEVTRVAREVGTEGKLGVQAEVKGVAGTRKDLTDNHQDKRRQITPASPPRSLVRFIDLLYRDRDRSYSSCLEKIRLVRQIKDSLL